MVVKRRRKRKTDYRISYIYDMLQANPIVGNELIRLNKDMLKEKK